MLAAPVTSSAGTSIRVAVTFGPPALPVYVQPPCPAPGYIWTPGYWAWNPDFGYFWVPGTWVMAPFPGALWTPGYWDWADGVYVWYPGYWGPVVGFYGGINYGYGYTGYGYEGGYWNRGEFFYNRAVNNITVTNIRNVYVRQVTNDVNAAPVSYHGGPAGTSARPTAEQLAAASERRSGPVRGQEQQQEMAQRQPELRASVNQGRPSIAATARAGDFNGRGAVPASRAGAPYKPETNRNAMPSPHAQPPQEGVGHGNPPAKEPRHAAPAPREMPHAQPPEEGGSHGNPPANEPREAAPTPREAPAAPGRGEHAPGATKQSPTHPTEPGPNAGQHRIEQNPAPHPPSAHPGNAHPQEEHQSEKHHETHGPQG
ncbi:MAG: hypothetical protein LAN62_09530 [Acidobacteriia bacterium]|nr:hypothetical protein [Terriglobia bacterium]